MRIEPTQTVPFLVFKPGESTGKCKKLDQNFSSLIKPRRIFEVSYSSPPPNCTHRSKTVESGSPLLDLNKSILGSDSLSCNSPNGICLSSNEVDGIIGIRKEVAFQIEKDDEFVEAVFEGTGEPNMDQ